MPVNAITLASVLMAAQPMASAGPRIEKVQAPCHIMIAGKCRVEKVESLTAGSGGNGGNATVNYNFYFEPPVGGNGGAGGNVTRPSGKSTVPVAPAPGMPRQGAASPATDVEGAVSYFTWNYEFQPEPGLRTWSRKGNRWSERYPDGEVKKVFNTIVDGKVQGCRGQLVSHTADPGFEVFIPHKGCARMTALFRRDSGAWNGLGQMRDVR